MHTTNPVTDDAGAAAMLASTLRPPVEAEIPGDAVGIYTLVQKLGEGGFGTVWEARQTEPLERDVALKIIKLGMSTLEVMARFELERATLARMNHPCIAHVLDAGMTPSGRPFFVMELVRGTTITHYSREHGLTLEQRLRLFQKVCAGVEHAHQKGIIHRDLKPSNVLVKAVDDDVVPKIIDFGIAKAITTDRLTELTLATRLGDVMGSPIYMSPEQAAASSDIDTRSDVYALGALLYELLTERPPFDPKEFAAAGQDEMRRCIREVEPVRPTQVRREISIDLELITRRAMAKERELRYDSAAALAEDVERFLNHEPVRARAPSWAYLTQRWMRRHRAGALAVGVSVLALLGGTALALWHAALARQAQRAAEDSAMEARRQLHDADAATHALIETMADMGRIRSGRNLTHEELRRAVTERVSHFQGDPVRKALMLSALGHFAPNREAVDLQRQALQLAEQALPADDERLWTLRLALLRQESQISTDKAALIDSAKKIADWMLAHFGREEPRTITAHLSLGILFNRSGRAAEALSVLTEVEAWCAQKPAGFREGTRVFVRIELAEALIALKRHDEALKISRENIQIARASFTVRNLALARSLQQFAEISHSLKNLDEAATASAEAVKAFVDAVGPAERVAQDAQTFLIKLQKERLDEAAIIAASDDWMKECEKRLGPRHEVSLAAIGSHATQLSNTARHAEARQLCEDTLESLPTASEGTLPVEAIPVLRALARAQRMQKDFSAAEASLSSLVALMRQHEAENIQRHADAQQLVSVLMAMDRQSEARAMLETCIAELKALPKPRAAKAEKLLQAAEKQLAEFK
ncbi:MAG: serine/threonine protein kinase [Verrucomicrobiaceae bacterium]|nr:serine/threonine protein kinase [Verrucomicrobiaceae bacterium]